MGREEKGRKGRGREGGKGREGRAPPIFYCTPSSSFLEICLPHRHTESAMAVVRQNQNFSPPQTPFAGAQDRQNLISWIWSLPAPTDPVW